MLHADILQYNRRQTGKKIKLVWYFTHGFESEAMENCLNTLWVKLHLTKCVTKQVILVLPVLPNVLSADILFILELMKNEKV